MPSPRIKLPKSARRSAWEEIIAELRANALLRDFVKRWETGEGRPDEHAPLTLAHLPLLRLDVGGGPTGWQAERQHHTRLDMVLTLAIEGTNVGDMLDYWSAVESALYPGDNTLFNKLTAFGVFSETITAAAVKASSLDGTKTLTAQGTITLFLDINT